MDNGTVDTHETGAFPRFTRKVLLGCDWHSRYVRHWQQWGLSPRRPLYWSPSPGVNGWELGNPQWTGVTVGGAATLTD